MPNEIEIRIEKDYREDSQKFIVQIVKKENDVAVNYILFHEVFDKISFSSNVVKK